MSIFSRFAACSLALAATAAPALAQDREVAPDAPATSRDSWATLGLGVGVMPSYEGSDDYVFSPVPAGIGKVKGMSFMLVGNRLSVDLIPEPAGPGWDFQLGPVVSTNLNRVTRRGIKDARVAALGKVDLPVELGAYVGIGKTGVITSDYDRFSLSVSWRHDVAGGHDSALVIPAVSYVTPLSTKAMVGLFGSAEHMGQGFADTYFSVTPAGSIATGGALPAYNARAGWKSWTVGAMGAVSLTGDLTGGLSMVGGATYRQMLNDAADSPITSIAGSRDQWMGALGLAYTF